VTRAVNRRRWWRVTIRGAGAIQGINNKGRTDYRSGNPQCPIGSVTPAVIPVAMVPMPAVITATTAAIMPVTSSMHRRREQKTYYENYYR
jgi:hypothetical protein